MDISLKQYKKDYGFSYSSGVFATLELLKNKPDKALRIFVSSKGEINKGLDQIRVLAAKYKVPVEVADRLVIKLSNSENCYAVGVFKKYDLPLVAADPHVLLVNPSDMGNVGTIIRTMVGFDVRNLAVIKPAVDLFDPKVVRSSTGAFFNMNFELFNSIEDYISAFPHHRLYPFMLDAGKDIKHTQIAKPYTLIFGNEGAGLPAKYKTLGQPMFIPHSNNIDSLNLSIAVGIALYSLS